MAGHPVWLTRAFVEALHDRLLAGHGGATGLRDEALLQSAPARPQHRAASDSADLRALAASCVAGIARDHPFVDGNKRTAFMAGYVLLARNGLSLEASEADATHTMWALAGGRIDEAEFAAWLRRHTRAAGA